MDEEQKAKQKVFGLIDDGEEEILNFLSEFVRHKSTNPSLVEEPLEEPQEENCQKWLRDQFEDFGFIDDVDYWEEEEGRPNLAGVWQGNGDGRDLLLNGHTDVVPVTDSHEADWTGPGPWSGERDNGDLWGRGSADMKSGITSFVMAAKMLNEAGVTLNGDVLLTTVIGEESGQHEIGCDTVLERGYTAPFAIIPEPTELKLFPVLKGEIYFKITVKGKAAHICNRHKCGTQPLEYGEEPVGISAIDKMMKIHRGIMNLERQWAVHKQHPMIPPGGQFININTIRGGEQFSSVPDRCEVTGSMLFNPGQTSEDVIEEVEQAIDGVVENDIWLKEHPPDVEIPWSGFVKEPVDVPVDHDGCQSLKHSFHEATGKDLDITSSPFVCDGNFWYEDGQDVVVFGPGSIDNAHGPNEYVGVDEVIDASKTMAAMMVDWCGVESLR